MAGMSPIERLQEELRAEILAAQVAATYETIVGPARAAMLPMFGMGSPVHILRVNGIRDEILSRGQDPAA
jgi:hypothetical protein